MNERYYYYNFTDCSKVSEEFLKAYLVIFENWSVDKVLETSKPDLIQAVTTFEKNRTPSRKEFSICLHRVWIPIAGSLILKKPISSRLS